MNSDENPDGAVVAAVSRRRDLLWYGLLVGVLWAVQWAFTLHSRTQLRFEEAAESIRNVYWLDFHGIYDGTSSNVGYYGLLLAVYRFFGFSVFTAKFVRAALALATLLSLASIARKTLPGKYGLAVVAAIGLSPTMLYFNTLQTSYGMDLQYLPLCLALLLVHPCNNRLPAFALSFGIGLIFMLAAMTYPTSIFSLPLLAACAVAPWRRRKREADSDSCHWAVRGAAGHPSRFWKTHGPHGLVFLAGMATPFVCALLWLERPGLLLHDPNAAGHGIFRGAGSWIFDSQNFVGNIRVLGEDLFIRGMSYHFELPIPEFGGVSGWVALSAAGIVSIALALAGPWRRIITGLSALLALDIVLPALTSGIPGLRRYTAALIAFYAIYFLGWKLLATAAMAWGPKPRLLAVFLLLLLPAHHLHALYWNWKSLPEPSPSGQNARMMWFNGDGDPEKSLARLLESTRRGEPLVLKDNMGRFFVPPYPEIYAALCGYRKWNHLPPVPLRGIDKPTGRLMTLDRKLWDTYILPH